MTKEDFISDLKNNLAVISGFAQLISKNPTDERVIDFCRIINEHSIEACKTIEMFSEEIA